MNRDVSREWPVEIRTKRSTRMRNDGNRFGRINAGIGTGCDLSQRASGGFGWWCVRIVRMEVLKKTPRQQGDSIVVVAGVARSRLGWADDVPSVQETLGSFGSRRFLVWKERHKVSQVGRIEKWMFQQKKRQQLSDQRTSYDTPSTQTRESRL